MAQLSKSLQEVVDTLRPSLEEQQCRKEAFQQVRSVLLQRWSDAQVHLFGSTANCLSICNNNDIDVCLEHPQDIQDQVNSNSAGCFSSADSCSYGHTSTWHAQQVVFKGSLVLLCYIAQNAATCLCYSIFASICKYHNSMWPHPHVFCYDLSSSNAEICTPLSCIHCDNTVSSWGWHKA